MADPTTPTVTRGRRRRGTAIVGRTRQGLLDGAARAFAERGIRGSTMECIARTAGVAKATLYNHFRTKDEVVRELLAAETRRVGTALAGRPPQEALLVLANELACHPVLRRLAADEPDLAVRLLTAHPDEWADATNALAVASGLGTDDAELIGRWALGLVLQPGTAALRRRQASRLAAVLAPRPLATDAP